jgi:dihydroxyacetone kinase-like predicted kinase
VPDADTGTNMVISLKSGAANIGDSPPSNLAEAALGFSGRVLLSAQGNSGTILSYFFVNLGDAMSGKEAIGVEEFAAVLGALGKKAMGDAMADAKPGTMLSVIEYSCQKVAASGATDVGSLLRAWHAAAEEAVQMTPDQLVVNGKLILKNAGVVDSGTILLR